MEPEKTNQAANVETILWLIEKRATNIKRCNDKILYYTTQLKCETSELSKLKAELESLQLKKQAANAASCSLLTKRKLESNSSHSTDSVSSCMVSESSSVLKETESQPAKKPQLFIPAMFMAKSKPASVVNPKSSHQVAIEKNRQCDVVESVGTSETAANLSFNSTNLIHSQHKRRLRCLELCPTDDTVFAASGLDGAVSLWEVENKGISARCLGRMDCSSPNQRRWPEDIAWHPDGRRIFAVHSADGGDSQVSSFSITQLGCQRMASFLEKKAHQKGIINRINFMPWKGLASSFVTGGSDHAVVLWKESEKSRCWNQELLHRSQHTSAVMAAFGLRHKDVVLSVGMDKRVVLFDLVAGRHDSKFLLDYKCLNALPSPCNSNLYLVQLGSPGKQLQLFDIREKPEALHVFGWDQEKSESHSALINPAWSPDGWRISSGSADPMIHIFDIRYRGHRPSQSMKAHSNRVFKAVWHPSLPLLVSISSDLHIGMHKYL